MTDAAIATLWRTRVADLFVSIRPPIGAESLDRVRFLLAHPFRWNLGAVGAFLASPASDVGPEASWPKLLEGFERAIDEVFGHCLAS